MDCNIAVVAILLGASRESGFFLAILFRARQEKVFLCTTVTAGGCLISRLKGQKQWKNQSRGKVFGWRCMLCRKLCPNPDVNKSE